jgi:hypothetical protein
VSVTIPRFLIIKKRYSPWHQNTFQYLWAQWLKPVIPAIQTAEIGRIKVQS